MWGRNARRLTRQFQGCGLLGIEILKEWIRVGETFAPTENANAREPITMHATIRRTIDAIAAIS